MTGMAGRCRRGCSSSSGSSSGGSGSSGSSSSHIPGMTPRCGRHGNNLGWLHDLGNLNSNSNSNSNSSSSGGACANSNSNSNSNISCSCSCSCSSNSSGLQNGQLRAAQKKEEVKKKKMRKKVTKKPPFSIRVRHPAMAFQGGNQKVSGGQFLVSPHLMSKNGRNCSFFFN